MFARLSASFGCAILLAILATPAAAQTSTAAIVPDAQTEGATPPVPLKPLDIPDLDYPIEALLANQQGSVTMNILVDQEGKITFVQLLKLSGVAQLDQQARQIATTHWAFKPATRGGQPVPGAVKIDL